MKQLHYNNKLANILTITSVWFCLSLSGCVTTTTGGFQKDTARLISVSVQASLEYLKNGDVESAHRHLQTALGADRKSPEAHNALALLFQYEGDADLAEKHFKLALKYSDDTARILNNYGSLLFSQRRYEESLKYLEQAALDTQYERRYLVYDNIGRCALQLKDLSKAEMAFRKALRLKAKSLRPLIELAQISFEKQDYNLTSNYLTQYNKLTRGSARSLWLGIRLERIQGDQNALASYVLALKNLFPKSLEYERYKESLVK
ncbi:MAG: type IV pilus biogenesis/stability protein PilW [Pseudomonadales bacterium]|nr:type IV pilus biogenesis/stability protein PilW [Pseudomonadales bacterium]